MNFMRSHRFSKAIQLIFLPILFLSTQFRSFAQEAKLEVQTVEKATIYSNIDKQTTGNETRFNINLNNQTGTDLHFQTINITITPDKALANGMPYMIGADEMQNVDGQMVRAVLADSPSTSISNMYLLFKRGDTDYLLVGLISWNTFLCTMTAQNGVIRISGDGDRKLIGAHKQLPFEKIVYLQGSLWQDLLDRYADMIAKENPISVSTKSAWTGWSTWDYYTQHFLAEDVTENIKAIKQLKVKTNIIQIDGGWWKQRGDYLDVRENLPGGIKSMISAIHKDGFKAGLHFDGFRASAGATIVKEHPEYFIHTEKGTLLEAGKDPVTKDPLVIWDYSHPGAEEYIMKVMKNARENWGVDYFKIDFMRQGLFKGISHLPVTNLERFRMGIKAMQKGMGKNIYFLACSANFGSVIGLAEASRVGGDIQPTYDAVKARAQHTSASYYLNQKVFNCDPDYLVLRSKEESDAKGSKNPSLTYDQAAMWASYVSIFGNARFESDNINLLKSEKKQLIEKSFSMPFFDKTVPIDWWFHYKTPSDAPNCFLARASDGSICLALFNWNDKAASFAVAGFKNDASFSEYNGNRQMKMSGGKLTVSMAGIYSTLLKYNGSETFDDLRRKISIVVAR